MFTLFVVILAAGSSGEVPVTRTQLILLAAGGSAALLLGAFGVPAGRLSRPATCACCSAGRTRRRSALGVVALVCPDRLMPALGALAALTTSGLGLYHTGVERGWWRGRDLHLGRRRAEADDLLTRSWRAAGALRPGGVVAGRACRWRRWNMIFSALLVAVWVLAARKS